MKASWRYKTDIRLDFSCATFLQICLQNASNCTDFSCDFQNFPGGGGMPPDPPRNFLLFFSWAIPGSDGHIYILDNESFTDPICVTSVLILDYYCYRYIFVILVSHSCQHTNTEIEVNKNVGIVIWRLKFASLRNRMEGMCRLGGQTMLETPETRW